MVAVQGRCALRGSGAGARSATTPEAARWRRGPTTRPFGRFLKPLRKNSYVAAAVKSQSFLTYKVAIYDGRFALAMRAAKEACGGVEETAKHIARTRFEVALMMAFYKPEKKFPVLLGVERKNNQKKKSR